jgi:hypothetical protein
LPLTRNAGFSPSSDDERSFGATPDRAIEVSRAGNQPSPNSVVFSARKGGFPSLIRPDGWLIRQAEAFMTVDIDKQGPNVFPLVEGIDVRDVGRSAEVIFVAKVDGQLATMTIRLSYGQAATLANLLEPFRKTRA